MSIKIIEAKTFKEKILGLLGKKEPIALLIKTRFGIHTFGMKFPIDVIVLDKNYKAVKIKEHLSPNNIFLWKPTYDIVLELPQGTIAKKKIKIGDTLEIRN